MKKVQKTISILLAMVMLFQLVPSAFASSDSRIEENSTQIIPEEGYMFSAEQQTENTVAVIVPPTFLVDNDVVFEEQGRTDMETGDLPQDRDSSVQPRSGANPEEDGSFLCVPYLYQAENEEQINLNTGSLGYHKVDYVLPGVNGMDVVLSRSYDSQGAGLYRPHYYYYDLPDTPFMSYYNSTYNYHHSLYQLGQGWRFDFPSIEWLHDTGYYYLYLSDGSVFPIRSDYDEEEQIETLRFTDTRIKGMTVSVVYENRPGNISDIKTLVTLRNGEKMYFDNSGRIRWHEDRFGNRIRYDYASVNGYKQITITDTLDREITITGAPVQDGHEITVSLPSPDGVSPGSEIVYTVEHLNNVAQALASVQDPEGNVTYYSYAVQNNVDWWYSSTQYLNNTFLNLVTITHPTGAQSVFTYTLGGKSRSNPNHTSNVETIYRITGRKDLEGIEESNEKSISYSGSYHVSGETSQDTSTQYLTTVETDLRIEEYSFDRLNRLASRRIKTGGALLEEYLCRYINAPVNGYRWSPIEETVRHYNAQGYFQEAVWRKAYNSYGEVTSEFSPLAQSTSDTLYRTSYTYYSFGILHSREYYTDENTKVKETNTQTTDHKNIASSVITVNNVTLRSESYTYDSHGNLLSILQSNPEGTDRCIRYTYQDGAYPASRTVSEDPVSAGETEWSCSYDNLGRQISVTDGNGNTTEYSYNDLNQVTEVVYPDESTVEYQINYPGNYVTVVNELGNSVKYTYTPLGLEYETVDVLTGAILKRNHYDEESRLTSVEEFVYGSVTEYSYDELDRTTSVTVRQGDAILSQELYCYDDAAENGLYRKVTKTEAGDIASPDIVTTEYTDRMGFTAKTGKILNGAEYTDLYTYDFTGNVTSVLTAADSLRNLSHTVRYEYNGLGQITKEYNALNESVQNEYDSLGQLVETLDHSGTPTSYAYDTRGRLVTQIITIDDTHTAQTCYTYDGNGNLITETAPANAVSGTTQVSYEYDSRNRLTRASQYDGETAALVTQYTYDAAGNLLSQTVGGSTTSYSYDRYGNILSMTDALVQSEQYTYTQTGKLLSKQDRNGTTSFYAYDALGRILSVQSGQDVVNYGYTKTGRLRYEENGSSRTGYSYDELGRNTAVREWGPESRQETIAVTLNAGEGSVTPGSLTVLTGDIWELPVPFRTNYDFKGWYLGDTLIENGTEISQTQDCTLTAHWDNTVYITLDFHDGSTPTTTPYERTDPVILPTPARTGYFFECWLCGETEYAGGETLTAMEDCTFTAQWTPITYTIYYVSGDINGTYYPRVYTYDVAEPFAWNAFIKPLYYIYRWRLATPQSIVYYDRNSLAYNLTDQNGATIVLTAEWKFGFYLGNEEPGGDPQIRSEGGTDRYAKYCSYDLAGNRTGFQLVQDGNTLQEASYTYDNLNRLTSVSENNITQTGYTYNVNGCRATQTLANGVMTEYTYNKANWVTGLVNRKGESTISSFAYTYYPSGQQATKTDHNGVVTAYSYDGLGRLTGESETNGISVSYAFDARGNRSSMAVTGSETYTVNYTYDANNRLTASQYIGGGQTKNSVYTYDANGNLLTKSEWRPQDGIAAIASYSYNSFNQLTGQTINGQSCTYAYNAEGIRTAKAVGTTTTSYYLDGGNVVGEKTGTDITTYLRGSSLISKTAGTTESFYVFNAHGDVVNLTNSSGTSTKAYQYDAFGNEKNPSSTDTNPFRYCGEYLDKETNEYYLRARYYDSSIGRFSQADTHWNPSNMIYGDDPQQIGEYKDPFGMSRNVAAPQKNVLKQTSNLYVYCPSNPILRIDKTGKVEVVQDLSELSKYGGVDGAGLLALIALIGVETFHALQKGCEWAYQVYYDKIQKQSKKAESEKETNQAIAVSASPTPSNNNDNKNSNNKNRPELGKKLDYLFGKASGNKHNVSRSLGLLNKLESIGISDTEYWRAYLSEIIIKSFYDSEPYLFDGSVARDILLCGPNGFLKLQTIWEGVKLITMYLYD